MPAKSRGGRKGKYAYQARKQGAASATTPAPQTAMSQGATATATSVAPPPRVAPRPASVAAAAVKISADKSRNVMTELRNIGILVGVMLIILVVLARVLA